MTHGHFDMGYSESTFSKYAFGRGGRGHKKEYAVYARENDDNYGRPLSVHFWVWQNKMCTAIQNGICNKETDHGS